MESSVVNKELDYLNIFFYGIGVVALAMVIMGIIFIERRRVMYSRKIEESEKKYRLLFERAADSIIIFMAEGPDKGRIIAANPAAASMHGYSIEEMTGMKMSDLDSPESRTLFQDRIRQVMETGSIRGDAIHLRKDGSSFDVEINSTLFVMDTTRYVIAIDRDISERKAAVGALEQVTKKLSLLNAVTFNDIRNAIFILNGYIALGKSGSTDEETTQMLDKTEESARKITRVLEFAKNYQDLGAKPARWQDVNQTFILGISHLDFSSIRRNVGLDNLEIFADSLLERVYYTFADNVLDHGGGATEITLGYEHVGDTLILFFSDNGPGVPDDQKEKIFERGYGMRKGMELFLVREILGITGITIRETGVAGQGARFEMVIPRGGYRFPKDGNTESS